MMISRIHLGTVIVIVIFSSQQFSSLEMQATTAALYILACGDLVCFGLKTPLYPSHLFDLFGFALYHEAPTFSTFFDVQTSFHRYLSGDYPSCLSRSDLRWQRVTADMQSHRKSFDCRSSLHLLTATSSAPKTFFCCHVVSSRSFTGIKRSSFDYSKTGCESTHQRELRGQHDPLLFQRVLA